MLSFGSSREGATRKFDVFPFFSRVSRVNSVHFTTRLVSDSLPFIEGKSDEQFPTLPLSLLLPPRFLNLGFLDQKSR